MIRAGILAVLILTTAGCTSTPADKADAAAEDTDGAGAVTATWRFEFVDVNEKPMGHMLLVFMQDEIDEPTCGNDDWQKMQVLEDNLDFDFGVDSRPAYSLRGPWLTIDLTSSVCYLDHILVGNIAPDGASGFFNVSHKIGGENVGSFTAHPVSSVVQNKTGSNVR